MHRRIRRMIKGIEPLGDLSDALSRGPQAVYELTKKPKGLGVPQSNRYARALEASRRAEERRSHQRRV